MTDILDRSHLAEFSGGDEALEQDVLAMFRGHGADYLVELAEANDPATFRAVAHKLKGAARAVGARKLAAIAEDAEKTGARSSSIDPCVAFVAPLKAAFVELCGVIDALKA